MSRDDLVHKNETRTSSNVALERNGIFSRQYYVDRIHVRPNGMPCGNRERYNGNLTCWVLITTTIVLQVRIFCS